MRTWILLTALLCACSSGNDDAPGPPGSGGSGQGGKSPDGSSGQGSGGSSGQGPTCAQNQNDAVRLALAPTCESCHKATSSRPFFASLASFEGLLVDNPSYIVKGQPDQSPLLAILAGQGTGAYPQMPLGEKSFAALSQEGKTGLTMEQLRQWITALPQQPTGSHEPDPTAASTRRLSAEEFLKAVQLALGYPQQGGGSQPILAGSLQPLSTQAQGIDYNDGSRHQIYSLLGGPAYLQGQQPESTWSPSSLAVVTQIALRECSRAVKNKEPVLFKHASVQDKLPEAEAAIRQNLGYLYRHFLGLSAPEAEVTTLLDRVFKPASERGLDTAWVETCSALVRHPYFLTF